MSTFEKERVPGAQELARELQEASASYRQIKIMTTVSLHSLPAQNMGLDNGSAIFTRNGMKFVIPFHAILQVEIG